jgi:cell division protein FtsB
MPARRRPTIRSRLSRLVGGDRLFRLAVAAVVVLSVLMLAGPVGAYLDGRDRVDVLEHQRDALEAEIERLEARVDDLHDHATIELLAREQLGLVMPGEVPYVVVVPEPERPRVAPGRDVPSEPDPWYRRLIDFVTGIVR